MAFERVVSSPLLRARQTCQQIGWDVVEIDPDLVEWDYGDYEGQRTIDIRKGRADWNLFRDGCPRGELPAQVADRADRLIARLRTLRGDIAICSHGDFGRVLGVRWIGLSVQEAERFLLKTASLSMLGHAHDRLDEPVIALWNAVSGG